MGRPGPRRGGESGEGRSGEVFAELAADDLPEDSAEEAVRYRVGDSGTFHRLASSGRASSRSSSSAAYSASSSFAVLRVLGCDELRRMPARGELERLLRVDGRRCCPVGDGKPAVSAVGDATGL